MLLPSVTIIVPAYNASNILGRCIEALLSLTYPKDKIEIIIVDNDSSDDTCKIVEKYPVILEVEDEIQSSYAARNKGALKATGDILAFTDSDCIVHPDWVSKGVEQILKTKNCGLVGGKINFLFQNKKCPNVLELYDSFSNFRQKEYIEQSHFSVTANMFVCKNIFKLLGGFRSDLKSSGDLEWGNRVSSNGYNLVFSENSIVFHPARHLFNQHMKKTKRVAHGKFDLYCQNISRGNQLWSILSRNIVPPVRRIWNVLTDKQINKFAKKIKVILLILFFKYLMLFWETQKIE